MAGDSGIVIGAQQNPLPRSTRSKISERLWSKIPNSIIVLISIEFLVAFIVVAFNTGRKAAQRESKQPSDKVYFCFKKEEEKDIDKNLIAANSNGDLRLVAQTKDLIFVFVKDKLEDGVFVVSRVSLLSVHNQKIQRKR